MRTTRAFFFLLAVLLVSGCTEKDQAPEGQTIEEFAWAAIDNGALLVDVRSPSEFNADHLPGALNIDHEEIVARAAELGDKDRVIIVYCWSGRRSGLAKDWLTKKGFTNVTNAGGLKGMQAARR